MFYAILSATVFRVQPLIDKYKAVSPVSGESVANDQVGIEASLPEAVGGIAAA